MMFITGRRDNFDYDARFAVLTGLEVQRCGDGYGTWLRMIKHRSRRYDMGRVYSFRVFWRRAGKCIWQMAPDGGTSRGQNRCILGLSFLH